MHVLKTLIAATAILATVACSKEAPPTSATNPSAPKTQAATDEVAATSPVAAENDRVCKSMFGLPCNALIHMLGPMNAELRKETRACVMETVSVYVSGKWIADNKYQDPKTGRRYGDHCIAVSL